MKLEIVTHCVNYPRLLTYQLSSLVAHLPTEVEIKYSLFYTDEDSATRKVARCFDAFRLERVTWNWQPLARSSVNRRSIGRNLAALATSADWIWFTDADYCLGPNALDNLAMTLKSTEGFLVYPKMIRASTHFGGDDLISQASGEPRLIPFPEPDVWTEVQQFNRAVGGVQIVRGDVARKMGYVPDNRRAQEPAATWQRAREDVLFRRALGTRGLGLDVGPIFRIRHSQTGRSDPNARL